MVTNKTDDGYEIKHLHFIVVKVANSDQVIVVNCDTVHSKKGTDPTVILHPGDHPRIIKDSYINYKRAKIVSISFINEQIAQKKAAVVEPISPKLTEKIREGISRSDATNGKVDEFYKEYQFNTMAKTGK